MLNRKFINIALIISLVFNVGLFSYIIINGKDDFEDNSITNDHIYYEYPENVDFVYIRVVKDGEGVKENIIQLLSPIYGESRVIVSVVDSLEDIHLCNEHDECNGGYIQDDVSVARVDMLNDSKIKEFISAATGLGIDKFNVQIIKS